MQGRGTKGARGAIQTESRPKTQPRVFRTVAGSARLGRRMSVCGRQASEAERTSSYEGETRGGDRRIGRRGRGRVKDNSVTRAQLHKLE